MKEKFVKNQMVTFLNNSNAINKIYAINFSSDKENNMLNNKKKSM